MSCLPLFGKQFPSDTFAKTGAVSFCNILCCMLRFPRYFYGKNSRIADIQMLSRVNVVNPVPVKTERELFQLIFHILNVTF
jgi:hypothetical protein